MAHAGYMYVYIYIYISSTVGFEEDVGLTNTLGALCLVHLPHLAEPPECVRTQPNSQRVPGTVLGILSLIIIVIPNRETLLSILKSLGAFGILESRGPLY